MRRAAILAIAVMLGGCAFEATERESATASAEALTVTHSVRGVVSGIDAVGLVLENSGTDPIGLSLDGTFLFPKTLEPGASYAVTVSQNPDNQTCTVQHGSGVIGDDDAYVNVTCADNDIVLRGTVRGLAGNVVLSNGSDVVSVHGDGSFYMPEKLGPNTDYQVTVLQQPDEPAATCTIENGLGRTTNEDVTDIDVTCVAL